MASTGSTGKREERTRRRAQEVAEAATKVFYERGYAAATVQDIADELGILKGSLYHYIDTKEDLLFGVLQSVQEDVTGVLDSAIAEDGLAPLDRIARYVEAQVTYNLTHLARISVYHHDYDQLTGERFDEIAKAREAHARKLAKIVALGQAEGDIDPAPDARLLVNGVFSTIAWPYRWFQPGGRWSRKAVAAECARYARQALRPADA